MIKRSVILVERCVLYIDADEDVQVLVFIVVYDVVVVKADVVVVVHDFEGWRGGGIEWMDVCGDEEPLSHQL